jgi:hypothetical protein
LIRVSDLVVPALLVIAVVAGLVPALIERAAFRSEREQAVRLLVEDLSRGERTARLAHQAGLAAWLTELRRGQQRIVNERCEGGPWCRQRLSELEGSARIAAALGEDARRSGAGAPPEPWQVPAGLIERELSRLQARLGELGGSAAWTAAGAEPQADADPDELARRRRAGVLLAEIAFLREAARP